MKKWQHLQLTLNNSESDERQGHYYNKTQKLFEKMSVQAVKYEFQKFCSEGISKNLISSTKVCVEFDFSSVPVIKSQVYL